MNASETEPPLPAFIAWHSGMKRLFVAPRATAVRARRGTLARSAVLFLLLAATSLGGCGLAGAPRPLAESAQQLVPHSDGDHFVFVWQRIADGKAIGSGIQVEHVTAVDGGDFEITLSENTIGVGRVRFRDVGAGIVLLSEDDLTRGLRVQYEPPLPYLDGPVVAGEQRSSSEARVTTLRDGAPVGALRVAQVIQVRPAGSVQSPFGAFDHAVAVDTTRTLQGPGGDVETRTAMVIVPGLGEIRSEGRAADDPLLRRQLACAIIGGRAFGDCRRVRQRAQDLDDTGPADAE